MNFAFLQNLEKKLETPLGLNELVNLAQQLVNLAQQANAPSATPAQRNQLNGTFQSILESIDNFTPQVFDNGGVSIISGTVGTPIRYASGPAANFAPAAIDARIAVAQATAGPLLAALTADVFEIDTDGNVGDSLIHASIMLGRYTGWIAQVNAVKGFLETQSEALSVAAGEYQGEVDSALRVDISEVSRELTHIGAMKQIIQATRVLFSKDLASEASSASQGIISTA